MVEPHVILELQPGDVFILMSSMITHGNAPLLPGKTRMLWTSWTAGGIFRCMVAGSKKMPQKATTLQEEIQEYKQNVNKFKSHLRQIR